jgi:hypothetical protein
VALLKLQFCYLYVSVLGYLNTFYQLQKSFRAELDDRIIRQILKKWEGSGSDLYTATSPSFT